MNTETTTTPETIDLSKVPASALAAALKEHQDAERKKKLQNKKQYETSRNDIIVELMEEALAIRNLLTAFKTKAMRVLPEFRGKMLEYGQLRKGDNNKGTFEIKTEHYKIVYSHSIIKRFDERAELAAQHLNTFLSTTVKKSDLPLHDLILSLLKRNEQTGDFDINLINRLYAMEDRFEDKNWKKAIELFKQSYSPQGTAQYARFFTKDAQNAWQPVLLDFSKSKAIDHETKKPKTEKA